MATTTVVEVEVAPDEVDLASGLLWGAGVHAVGEEERDGRVVLRVEPPEGGVDALAEALGPRWGLRVVAVDDGLDGWREHARVVRAGRVVVHPPWLPLGPVDAGEVVVEVDPGPTFGHGAHPTTRLCLEALDRLLAGRGRAAGAAGAGQGPGAGPGSVLDVGCGSGVLAVAAVRLGAARSHGVDVDPEAVRVTLATAARNGVADRVAAGTDWPEGRFAVVVANIGAATLRDLAPRLAVAVAPGGTLVVSGLLDPPPDDLAPAFAPLVLDRDDRVDGWTALTFRAP